MIHTDNSCIKQLTSIEKMDEYRWIAIKTLRHLLKIRHMANVRHEITKTISHIRRWSEKIEAKA